MNKVNLILAALLLAVPAVAFSELPLKDVPGWSGTTWGMSTREVREVLGPQFIKKQTESDITYYEIEDFEIFGASFHVSFHWNSAGKLEGVSLSLFEADQYRDSTGHKIVDSLKLKYGEGSLIESEQSENPGVVLKGKTHLAMTTDKIKIRWAFPSTLIEYSHIFFDSRSTGSKPLLFSRISIDYTCNESSKL